MKKQTLCIIIVLLPVFFLISSVKGQTAIQSSTTAHVFARVYSAITSVKTSQESFGHFFPLSYDGQLINGPDGILSVKGNAEQGGDIQYSTSFDVSGNGNTAFAISVPRSPITLTNQLDSKTMTLKDWKYVSLDTAEEGEIPFGYKTVNLNATLKLGSQKDNPVGFYTGFYTVTFGFN
ncbi:MAG: DUF4402 domain-containing protein [Bacteroidetes bacterium]|nr:DUF4402 domain-containing protein [Bacteroidota bacterium]